VRYLREEVGKDKRMPALPDGARVEKPATVQPPQHLLPDVMRLMSRISAMEGARPRPPLAAPKTKASYASVAATGQLTAAKNSAAKPLTSVPLAASVKQQAPSSAASPAAKPPGEPSWEVAGVSKQKKKTARKAVKTAAKATGDVPRNRRAPRSTAVVLKLTAEASERGVGYTEDDPCLRRP
jgi:hypothetical protein